MVHAVLNDTNRKSWGALGGALLLAFMGWPLAGCDRTEERSPREEEGASPTVSLNWGDAPHAFEVRMSSMAKLPGGANGFDLSVQGTLHLKQISTEADGVVLVCSFSGIEGKLASASSETTAALLEPLQRPAYLKYRDGLLVDSWYPQGKTTVALGLWRTVASALQLAANDPGKNSWQALEHDSTGQAKTLYTLSSSGGATTVSKTKSGYVKLLLPTMSSPMSQKARPEVIKANTEFTIEKGMLSSLVLSDAVDAPTLQGAALSAEIKLHLKRVAGPAAPEFSPGDFDKRHTTHLHLPPQKPLPVDATSAQSMFDEERIQGRSFADVLADFRDASAQRNMKERMSLHFALVSYLRSRPETIEKALLEVNNKSPAAEAVISALGTAGTDRAQEALAQVVENKGLGEAMREKAIMALSQTENPMPQSIATLSGQLDDPLTKNQATFGLGAMARRFRDSGNLEQVQVVRDLIDTARAQAGDARSYHQVLGAIANSGDSYFLPELRKASTHEDHGIRSLVIQGLKHQLGEEADTLIIEMLRTEQHRYVQQGLLRVLKGRTPTQRLEDALQALMRREGLDEGVAKSARQVQEHWGKLAQL